MMLRTFRTLHSRLQIEVAMFELELRERASHATFARITLTTLQPELELLRECTSRTILAGAMGTHFAHPLLHLKVSILQPELSESSSRTFALNTCEFSAEALRERTSRANFCTYSLRFRSCASGNALHVLP